MLIIVGIIVAVSLLGKASMKIAAPPPLGPPGEYSETGNAGTLTHKFHTPDGTPTWTPSNQSVSANWTLPFQLVAKGSADPALTAMRATFRSEKPALNMAGMVGIQNFLGGGYK